MQRSKTVAVGARLLKASEVAVLRVLLGIVFAAVTAAEPVWVSFDGTPEPTPPTVTITSASPTSVTFHVVIHGMFVQDTVVEGTTYHVLQFPDEGMMTDVGLPQLPQVTRLVGFAPGAAVTAQLAFNDELVLSGYCVFPPQCPVDYPCPPLPFSINSAVYNSDAWFPAPGATASASELGVWRDLGTAVGIVRPLVFNPVQHELRVYRSVTATCEFAGGETLPGAVLPDYHKAYSHTLTNFSHLGVGTFAPQEDPVYWILLGESWPGGQLTRGIEPLRV